MPIPRPRENEVQDRFMSRCMGDEKMNTEFPDNKQRVAVCLQSWKDKNKKKKSGSSEMSSEFIEKFLQKYPQYREYFGDNL